MAGKASMLVKDLTNVPSIVGGLGLSVAEAQKAFNLDYIENIERLVALAKVILGEQKQGADGPEPLDAAEKKSLDDVRAVFEDLLRAAAPPQYQFTETTLAVRMDLAQSMDVGGSAGFGVNLGAVAVNAALTLGYSYDYRAAAEVKTVLHATKLNAQVTDQLLKRAATVNDKVLELPARSEVDKAYMDKSAELFEKVVGKPAPKVEETPEG